MCYFQIHKERQHVSALVAGGASDMWIEAECDGSMPGLARALCNGCMLETAGASSLARLASSTAKSVLRPIDPKDAGFL